MTVKPIKITCAQLNPTVGDIEGNACIMLDTWEHNDNSCDLIIFPELFLCGYPPEDLVLNTAFVSMLKSKIDDICKTSRTFQSAAIIPSIWEKNGAIYNAALLIENGEIRHIFYKHKLANSHVFDEPRTFTQGSLPKPYNFRGHALGVMICEDAWHTEVTRHLKENGAQALIAINGSPFQIYIHEERNNTALTIVKDTGLDLIYLNMIGGQDELVFDGRSFVLDKNGSVTYQSPAFEDDVFSVTLDRSDNTTTITPILDITGSNVVSPNMTTHDITSPNMTTPDMTTPNVATHGRTTPGTEIFTASLPGSDYVKYTALKNPPNPLEIIYKALVMGIRDYAHKNGFNSALLGLSGGIDSALTAAIATDALGSKNVHCVLLPSEFTSDESNEDAKACASQLNILYETIPISIAMNAFEETIPNLQGIAHENTQSRIRGTILMALSNMSGALLLTTGNKSEMAVGYCTLYGDMNGGFNPLKDIYKTDVYKLTKWRNEQGKAPVIPERIITKAPTAELRTNQKDEDSLPPYDLLDDILRLLVDYDDIDWKTAPKALQDMHTKCLEHKTEVERIARLLKINEYKRFQAPPGTRISRRGFGRDRRYPLTNHFVNRIAE